ncbi:hypothetical protein HAX54_015695, partial [Datura stramonium]|nr:hypothetical protein [Datura stramonium]
RSGKNISEYFGGRPTKVQLIKEVKLTKKEANKCVEEVKREDKEEDEEMKKEIVELDKRREEIFRMISTAQ